MQKEDLNKNFNSSSTHCQKKKTISLQTLAIHIHKPGQNSAQKNLVVTESRISGQPGLILQRTYIQAHTHIYLTLILFALMWFTYKWCADVVQV